MNETPVLIDPNQFGSLSNSIQSVTSAVYQQNESVVSYLGNLQSGMVELLVVGLVSSALVAFAVAFLVARRR